MFFYRLPGLLPSAPPDASARLHARKPNSLTHTWALVLAAIILYIPANMLPMTITSSLGNKQTDTILSGVIYFLQSGLREIGAVILIASIFVPACQDNNTHFFTVERPIPVDLAMDGDLGRVARMTVRWTLLDLKGQWALITRRSHYSEKLSNVGYDAWMAGRQYNIRRQSEEIADLVKERMHF